MTWTWKLQRILCSTFRMKSINMPKSDKRNAAPQLERKPTLSTISLSKGVRFDSVEDMSPFEKGYRKLLKKLNKTVVELKQKISLSSLPKEFDFIGEGLDSILDLSLKYRLYSENLFHTLETTVTVSDDQKRGKQENISMLEKKEPDTISSASVSVSDVESKQSKRPWWESDTFSVEDIPDGIDLPLTQSKPFKRIKSINAPDSSSTSFVGAPNENFVMEEEWVTVFIDGACSDNGRADAKAGVGVWFYPNCPFNVAEPVRSNRKTNNVAEIEASIRAIQQAHLAGIMKLRVKTDSMFLINCITKWMFGWIKNGWKTANGKPVINKPEIEELAKVMKMLPVKVDWVHVKGHNGIVGNEAADFLARQGAEKSSRK